MDQNVGEDPHPHNPFKGKACLRGGLEATTEILFCDSSKTPFKPRLI